MEISVISEIAEKCFEAVVAGTVASRGMIDIPWMSVEVNRVVPRERRILLAMSLHGSKGLWWPVSGDCYVAVTIDADCPGRSSLWASFKVKSDERERVGEV